MSCGQFVAGTSLLDTEREALIESEGRAMEQAYNSGDLDSAGEHRQRMEKLIRERSPDQVARMERERGLLR